MKAFWDIDGAERGGPEGLVISYSALDNTIKGWVHGNGAGSDRARDRGNPGADGTSGKIAFVAPAPCEGGLRSYCAGPPPRTHRAAQYAAPVPGPRPRGAVPDRRFHRHVRRSHRQERHPAAAHTRRGAGERAHVRVADI